MVALGHPLTSRRRRGVTLLELLLVLVILVILAGMTWPALDRPLAHQRLRKSADQVRTEWTRARIEAMSSGQTIVFRYTLGESRYAIESQHDPEFVSEETAQGGYGVQTPLENVASTTSSSQRTLPEKIVFSGGEVDFDTRADLVSPAVELTADAESSWSDPILFFPDGTCSKATLRLRNEFDDEVELTLRGLTGTVTVGDTYVAREALP